MRTIRAWFSRLQGVFKKRRADRDLAAELESHLAMHIEDNLRLGMSPEEALRQALIKLGGLDQIKECYRDRRSLPWLDSLFQDVRFAIRMLRKSPGFTAVAVLTLSLGICASVTIFAFVDAALIRPLPFANPARLVDVTESAAPNSRGDLSYMDYVDWKRLNNVFASFDVYSSSGYLLKRSSGTEPVRGARVSDGFFRTLGIAPIVGHDFYRGENLPAEPATVMLSYEAWQKWFGGKNDVVAQPVTLNGMLYTIIGVLPANFQFAPVGTVDFWTTLEPLNSCEKRRSCHNLSGVARLRAGISVQAALADTKSIAALLEKQYPDSNHGQGATVAPLSKVVVGDIQPILLLLLSGAGLLLLIACVNVTSLLLVRSESRAREIGVRRVLGASRQRLVRQFAVEGLLLAAVATIVAILSARLAMQLLIGLIPVDIMLRMPYFDGLGLNLHIMTFAAAIAVITTVMFALTPALRMWLSDLAGNLAQGGRSSTGRVWRRLGSNLVVVEVAVAVVLLVGAGLLGMSLYNLLHVSLGFQSNHLAALEVAAPSGYAKEPLEIALGRQIISTIGSLPGVQSVALTTRQLPVSFNGNSDWIRFPGRPYNGEHNEVNERDVSATYFTALHAQLLGGRYFSESEDESKPMVAIINEALARKYFGSQDPIGQQFGDTKLSPQSLKTIVGVVDDIREGPLDEAVWPAIYLPFNQSPDAYMGILVRTAQAPDSMLASLEGAIHQIDPDIGVVHEATMSERIDDSQTSYFHRSAMWLVGSFATVALLLGAIGLYGVIAYSVNQRTREIGIRMALGAQDWNVMRDVLREGGFLIAIGLALGIIAAFVLDRLLMTLLYGVTAANPVAYVAGGTLLAIAALVACYIPARRAMKVDPMVALRHE